MHAICVELESLHQADALPAMLRMVFFSFGLLCPGLLLPVPPRGLKMLGCFPPLHTCRILFTPVTPCHLPCSTSLCGKGVEVRRPVQTCCTQLQASPFPGHVTLGKFPDPFLSSGLPFVKEN